MIETSAHTSVTPLKSERMRRGVIPDAIAKAVGVSRSTISRIENGRKRASPELAIRIEKFFSGAVTRDQILFPEEYAPRRTRLKKAS
jgi:DNA-binding XRE family transcriptional regulator